MAISHDSDLSEFVGFAQEQLDKDGAKLTPEEVLDLWRVEHPSADELSESVAAIQRAIEQADRGEGSTLDEFERTFRTRHRIPGDE